MGGWCKVREDCAHHHAEPDTWGTEPAERLCEFGQEEPAPLSNLLSTIELHQAMVEAHRTMIQGTKYPETVNKLSISASRSAITDFCQHWLKVSK